MILPRWTVYPALFVLTVFAFLGVPSPSEPDPHAGAAVSASPAWGTNDNLGPAPGATAADASDAGTILPRSRSRS